MFVFLLIKRRPHDVSFIAQAKLAVGRSVSITVNYTTCSETDCFTRHSSRGRGHE